MTLNNETKSETPRLKVFTLCPDCNEESEVPLSFPTNDHADIHATFYSCPHCSTRIDRWLRIPQSTELESTKDELTGAKAENERLTRERDAMSQIKGTHDCACEVCSTISAVCPASASTYALEIVELRVKLAEAENYKERLRYVVERMTTTEFKNLGDDFEQACETIDAAKRVEGK